MTSCDDGSLVYTKMLSAVSHSVWIHSLKVSWHKLEDNFITLIRSHVSTSCGTWCPCSHLINQHMQFIQKLS